VARKPSGSPNQPEHWTMYFDGSLKLGDDGAAVLFISPRGEQLKYVFQILFEVCNNEAEYEALLQVLHLVISLGIKQLLICGDSLLVVQQVNKEWDINKDTMDAYVTEICKLGNKFSGLEIHHVIRENNVGEDVLSKLSSDRANVAELPELFGLKCASHRYTADNNSTHFKQNIWSVGSPPDTTTVQQDRSRFTSHEGEFTITAQLLNF
jgi:ribonuclease HI